MDNEIARAANAKKGSPFLTTDQAGHYIALSGRALVRDRSVFIEGRHVADRLVEDKRGRSLPAWPGCRVLTAGEVFLLMEGVPDSFDGRYFGTDPRGRDHRQTDAILDPMMSLRFALLAVGVLLAPAAAGALPGDAAASPFDRWSPFIAEASGRFGIPASWIRAVIRAESGGQAVLDGRPITSAAGAMGLMQLMPRTWTELRDRLGLGADAYDPP